MKRKEFVQNAAEKRLQDEKRPQKAAAGARFVLKAVKKHIWTKPARGRFKKRTESAGNTSEGSIRQIQEHLMLRKKYGTISNLNK